VIAFELLQIQFTTIKTHFTTAVNRPGLKPELQLVGGSLASVPTCELHMGTNTRR
jgi:hypothetical protein